MPSPRVPVRPNEAAQKAARRGLAARKEAKRSGRCCTPAGMTRARSILRGEQQDAVDIRSWFRRHEGYYEAAKARAAARGQTLREAAVEEKAIQAWWIWGGDPMRRLAEQAVARAREPNPPEGMKITVRRPRGGIIVKAYLHGRLIGGVQAYEKVDTYAVANANVVPELQRQGIGRMLYRRLAQEACKKGKTLISEDFGSSRDAKAFWRSEVEAGNAERTPEGFAYHCSKIANPTNYEDLSTTWETIFDDLDLDYDDEWDAEEKAAPEFTRRTGLPLLGAGNTRVVFALDDRLALKLAYNADEGRKANLRECAIWEKTAANDPQAARQWLAPVAACSEDGSWLVMERVAPVTRQELPSLDWGSPAEQALSRLGITDAAHRAQWGRLPDGRLVVIDYAGRDANPAAEGRRFLHGSRADRWLPAVERGTAAFVPSRSELGLKGWEAGLEPLPGRVYLTPHQDKAFLAATYGDREGETIILDVEVGDDADVLPDEDCVADVLGQSFGYPGIDSCGWGDDDLPEDFVDAVREIANEAVSPPELAKVERALKDARDSEEFVSDLQILAPLAKKVALRLDDALVERFIELGANVAVKPPLSVLGAWIFDKKAWDEIERAGEDDVSHGLYVASGTTQRKRGVTYKP